MMEQPNMSVHHGYAQRAACVFHFVIPRGPSRLCNVPDAMRGRTIDVIAEWDKAVRDQAHAINPGQEFTLLGFTQGIGRAVEHRIHGLNFPLREVSFNVANSPVDSILAFDVALERQTKNLRMLTQLPDVCLCARELCTIDAGLLAGANADCLTAIYVAD